LEIYNFAQINSGHILREIFSFGTGCDAESKLLY
jgi:hypothetical protein